VRTLKVILVWFGVQCVNLRLKLGVDLVDWLFQLLPKLRAA